MTALLFYLLKANLVLALFATAYYGLLRRLTFFGLNRAYLLGAFAFAAIYPALPVPALLPAPELPGLPVLWSAARETTAPTTGTAAAGFGGLWLLGGFYAVGAAGLLLRLLGQLLSLAWLHRRTQPARVLGRPVRVLPEPGGPFSFGRAIYVDDDTLSDPAALAVALAHEQAHGRQAHTLDVLLTQVFVALAWPNPAAWLLRRAVLDNLEFLADRAAVSAGASPNRRAYQRLLLARHGADAPGLALTFYFTAFTFKNRILMLNQPASSPRQLGRYLLAAPLVVALALGYSGARAQTAAATAATAAPTRVVLDAPAPNGPHPVYFLDGRRLDPLALTSVKPDSIASLNVVQGQAARSLAPDAEGGVVLITSKARAQSPAVLALNKRANQLLPKQPERLVQVNALVPRALATITKRYPDARLSGEVVEMTDPTTGKMKYKVQLARGRRPFYIYLTPEGEFISE